MPKKKTGRPTKYKASYCESLVKFFDREPFEDRELEHYDKDGNVKWVDFKRVANRLPTVILFAKHIKINVSTVYEWLKNHKEFSDAFTRAKELQKIYAGKSVSGTTLLGGLTKDQLSQLNKIQTNIRQDPDIKGFITIRDSYDRTQAAAVDPSAAGDLALIFNYMKMLDPTSVVRESEFANAAATGSWGERIKAAAKKIQKGQRLSDEMRADFVDRATRLYQPKFSNYQSAVSFYKGQAETFDIDPGLVIRDFTTPNDVNGDPTSDLDETINANANNYKTREELGQALNNVFPEFSLDEIMSKVYQLIPDK